MKKMMFLVAVAAMILIAADQKTEAGCYYKDVTFVNTSGNVLYIYGQIDLERYDIWYCGYLGYSGFLYPGQQVTYRVPRNQVGWFRFTTSTGQCCNYNIWASYWIDPWYGMQDDVFYL